jgi:hypothetical protein
VPATNNTSNPTTKLDLFYGPGGGTLNDTGLSISHNGVITFVPSQTFSGTSLSVKSITLPGAGVQVFAGVQPLIQSSNTNGTLYIGDNSNLSKGTGADNTSVGSASMLSLTTGAANSAFGAGALQDLTSGGGNTAVGDLAESQMTTGGSNTAVGVDALYLTTGGLNNTAVGYNAGQSSQTGIGDTFIGYQADATVANLINSTAIGNNARVSTNNALVLGATPGPGFVQPAVGIGTATPSHALEVVDNVDGSLAGVYATTANQGSAAVYGLSTATSGTGSNGGYFESRTSAGSGVVGFNEAGGIGGYFQSNGTAGYFLGSVTITGLLTKGGGSFKIDDPIDPANKYLSHSFVESPDMMNIYNGNVTTDAKGFATVSMPDWFEALNRDFRYQLTTINSFSRATVAAELKDGKFRIRTSQPRVKVSWQVTGIRHDEWANAHRIPTEEIKPSDEHGKYLHPELFGAGPEKQIGTQPAGAAAVNAKVTPPASFGTSGVTAMAPVADGQEGRR